MHEEGRQPEKVRDGLSFIHSSLDDAGLAPAEFRVYCHVNRAAGRHGVCTQALRTIANHCGYGDDTTRKALQILNARRMLRRNDIPGHGVEYRLNPPAHWLQAPLPTPLRKNRRGEKSQGSPLQNAKGNPYENVGGKGIPSEGIPSEGEIGPPIFEPVQRGLYRREYEGMIADAEAEIKKVRNDPTLHERVLKKEVAEHCAFLRNEAQATPDKAAQNMKRVADHEKNPANYHPGTWTAPGNAIAAAWKRRISDIRAAMNGIKG